MSTFASSTPDKDPQPTDNDPLIDALMRSYQQGTRNLERDSGIAPPSPEAAKVLAECYRQYAHLRGGNYRPTSAEERVAVWRGHRAAWKASLEQLARGESVPRKYGSVEVAPTIKKDWMYRGPRLSEDDPFVVLQMNLHLNPESIRALDDVVSDPTREMRYKFPPSGFDPWKQRNRDRHDTVTIYCQVEPTGKAIDELVEVASKFARHKPGDAVPDDHLIGDQICFGLRRAHLAGIPAKKSTELCALLSKISPHVAEGVEWYLCSEDGVKGAIRGITQGKFASLQMVLARHSIGLNYDGDFTLTDLSSGAQGSLRSGAPRCVDFEEVAIHVSGDSGNEFALVSPAFCNSLFHGILPREPRQDADLVDAFMKIILDPRDLGEGIENAEGPLVRTIRSQLNARPLTVFEVALFEFVHSSSRGISITIAPGSSSNATEGLQFSPLLESWCAVVKEEPRPRRLRTPNDIYTKILEHLTTIYDREGRYRSVLPPESEPLHIKGLLEARRLVYSTGGAGALSKAENFGGAFHEAARLLPGGQELLSPGRYVLLDELKKRFPTTETSAIDRSSRDYREALEYARIADQIPDQSI